MTYRRTLYRIATLAGVALALWGLIALMVPPSPDMEGVEVPEMVLEVPDSSEVTILEVVTGALPNGAELQLVDATGKVVAVVSFFGQINPAQVQYHQVPLLSALEAPGEIVVTGVVVTSEGRRGATPSEFQGVRVLDN